MNYLPTTLFRVLKPNPDFPNDFQIIAKTDWVVTVLDSNSNQWPISPLVIDMRIRQGQIEVLAYPWHPSHVHVANYHEDSNRWSAGDQCSRCMVKQNEEPIQYLCPLADREIIKPLPQFPGPDAQEEPYLRRGPGPGEHDHPWRKD
jgi:hypothetical protein